MTVEEALISALNYEHKVRDHYRAASTRTDDAKGREIFSILADEEQGHVDYLNARLEVWRREGILNSVVIKSVIPTRDWLARGKGKLHKVSLQRSYDNEIGMLKDALKLERGVSEHYRALVGALKGEAQQMFRSFLEIEDAHTAIVQSEIDQLEKNAFWFDFSEFDLEAQ